MIYFWAIFGLLAALVILNARYAVSLYGRNKQLFILILHLAVLTVLVVIVMHATGRIMDIFELHFKGLTGLVSDIQ